MNLFFKESSFLSSFRLLYKTTGYFFIIKFKDNIRLVPLLHFVQLIFNCDYIQIFVIHCYRNASRWDRVLKPISYDFIIRLQILDLNFNILQLSGLMHFFMIDALTNNFVKLWNILLKCLEEMFYWIKFYINLIWITYNWMKKFNFDSNETFICSSSAKYFVILRIFFQYIMARWREQESP